MRIIFIGPPGSGKGTQCQRLSALLCIPHLSSGVLLRQSRDNTSFGRMVAEHIDAGRLAPDEVAMGIVSNRLADSDCAVGYLLDGFPRNVNQAKMLDDLLQQRSERIDLVLVLEVVQDELIRRLEHRATVENREDDNAAAIASRLEIFRANTASLVEFYQQRGIVHLIDGMKSPDEVFQQVQDCLPCDS